MTTIKTTLNYASLSALDSYFTFLARFMGFFNHALNPISSRKL